MAISITPSPFGSVTVTLDGELGGVLSVSVLATSNSALNMDLGVPGPTGATGATGATGQGVAAGGTTGQALVKSSNSDYATTWATISSGGGTWGSITGTLSSQTDLYDALNGKLSLTGGTMSGGITLTGPNYDPAGQIKFTDTADSGFNTIYSGVGINFGTGSYWAWDEGIYTNYIKLTTGGELTFPDSTTQTTAGLPLTGGTMTGGLTIDNGNNFIVTGADGDLIKADYNANTVKLGLGASTTLISGNWITLPTDTGTIILGRNYEGDDNFGIKFEDDSFQTTAFPPAGGTSSQYINGTGALTTFPPLGDRYLTTSTSTLTIDNGNGKTMTVGTGLSYSTQQDITVSYDAGHHIHGTIVSYNSSTGVMVFDANSHTGTGTYSNWEVNVGGVNGAILPVDGTAGQVLAKINSTNFNTEWISLGTMSTEPASAYLSTASAVANYQTISGMSAYLSTSAASSTYLTQSNASSTYLTQSNASSTYQTQSGMSAYLSTASASANFIGTSAYATTAQAQAGTSTTTVVSPSTLLDAKYFGGGKFLTGITWSTATSGTGANAGANGINARVATAPTTATGYAQNSGAVVNNTRGGLYNGGIDWSKRVVFGGRFSRNTTTPDTNTVFRFSLGRFSGQAPSDILSTDKQVGIKVSGSGAIVLYAANGSALSTVTSSFTPTNNSAYDVVITSDGAGNVILYVNGSSVATSTGGPTSSQGTNYSTISFETQNSSTLTNGNMVVFLTDAFVQVNS